MASRVQQHAPSRVRLRLYGPGAQRNGVPLKLADLGIPPGQRSVI
jgi:hypothetical protein